MAETKTKTPKKITSKKETAKPERYFEAIGGRKNAHSRVRIVENKKKTETTFIVNNKNVDEYFPTEHSRVVAREALAKLKVGSRFDVSARVCGGGAYAQAEALRHGLARALVKFQEEWRKKLKKSGYLKRDPRQKERRKFGLKKARKAPQWSKR